MTQANSDFLGTFFRLGYNPNVVTLHVPFVVNPSGKPSSIHQSLGELRRKNDWRWEWFRKKQELWFSDYSEGVTKQGVKPTIVEALDELLAGFPSRVDQSAFYLTRPPHSDATVFGIENVKTALMLHVETTDQADGWKKLHAR